MGRPAKALTIERWSVGSNPTLSAPTSRLGRCPIDPARCAHSARAICRSRDITALSFVCGQVTPALRFDDGGTRPWVLGWVARVARDAYRGDHTCDTTTTDRSTTRPTRRTTSRPSSG